MYNVLPQSILHVAYTKQDIYSVLSGGMSYMEVPHQCPDTCYENVTFQLNLSSHIKSMVSSSVHCPNTKRMAKKLPTYDSIMLMYPVLGI